ncbi:MAG: hypothetical protein HYV29_04995 [Ignavibacteriales bacterium]|nr:hypothetical protein [Ignavibacteriales bacterium]
MESKIKIGRYDELDIIQLCIIAVILIIVWSRYVNHESLPFEDAAMIFRYAEHIAQGHGFVWNIGDAPVDGATDVLFTLIIALFVKVSIPADIAVQIVIILSHIGIVGIVYHTLRHGIRAPHLIAGTTACFIAVGSYIRYYEAYFATSFFALCATVMWYVAIRIIENNDRSLSTIWKFSLSGLLLGVARPEGVFLAFFILLAVVYRLGFGETKKLVMNFVVVYLVLGGIYFAFHWIYFGYPLPNPFYKKGGGFLYTESFRISSQNIFRMLLPLSIYYGSLLLIHGVQTVLQSFEKFREKKFLIITKESLYPLVPIILFTALWILMSNEMNYVGRYQYAAVPIAIMSWYPSIRILFRHNSLRFTVPEYLNTVRSKVIIASIVMLSIAAMRLELLRGTSSDNDGRYDVAVQLHAFKSKQYTMAVSEAGLLPYYSGWKAMDTWGLNDIRIAQQGGITADYIRRFSPDIIMFYAPYIEKQILTPETPYLKMVNTLFTYARSEQYILAAAYGTTPYGVHYYFVKKENPDAAVLIGIIKNTRYTWWLDGRECFNFAAEKFQTIE